MKNLKTKECIINLFKKVKFVLICNMNVIEIFCYIVLETLVENNLQMIIFVERLVLSVLIKISFHTFIKAMCLFSFS